MYSKNCPIDLYIYIINDIFRALLCQDCKFCHNYCKQLPLVYLFAWQDFWKRGTLKRTCDCSDLKFEQNGDDIWHILRIETNYTTNSYIHITHIYFKLQYAISDTVYVWRCSVLLSITHSLFIRIVSYCSIRIMSITRTELKIMSRAWRKTSSVREHCCCCQQPCAAVKHTH